MPSAPAASQTRLFFWQTESSAAELSLLGSIHVGTKELYPLDPRIEAAFSRADTLVVEVDADDEQLAELMPGFFARAMLPPGQTVFDGLEPETVGRLKAKMQKLELAPEQLERFAPWLVTMTISLKEIENAGFSAQHGIDRHFLDRARGKLRIISLEQAEEQLQLLLGMGRDIQRQDLLRAVDEDQGQSIRRLMQYWQRGDTSALESEMRDLQAEYPELFDELFTFRNQRMVEKIAELSRQPGSHFVVVGAGHLVGPNNVVEGLRERGIDLARR